MRTVLVIDDDLVNRLLARALLEYLAWNVIDCENGRSGLFVLSREPVSAVLLDISLPDISGIELCKELRHAECGRSVRIIAYTAMAMASERQALLDAGFDEILLKPVNLSMVRKVFV
jgi:CheY-like chemotaxis protein